MRYITNKLFTDDMYANFEGGNKWAPLERHSKSFNCSAEDYMLSDCEAFNDTSPRSASGDVKVYCGTGQV